MTPNSSVTQHASAAATVQTRRCTSRNWRKGLLEKGKNNIDLCVGRWGTRVFVYDHFNEVEELKIDESSPSPPHTPQSRSLTPIKGVTSGCTSHPQRGQRSRFETLFPSQTGSRFQQTHTYIHTCVCFYWRSTPVDCKPCQRFWGRHKVACDASFLSHRSTSCPTRWSVRSLPHSEEDVAQHLSGAETIIIAIYNNNNNKW